MDTDTVIQALESCIDERNGCYNCPIRYKNGNVACRLFTESYNSIPTELVRRALEMIKKQVQKETPMTMERINVVKVDGNDFYKGFCPACQTLQYGIKSKYCDQCGQAVKWDA